MAVTRGDLRTRILRYLNKTSDNTGFYSTDKVSDAIEEALDYVSTHMFMDGSGWLVSIDYLTTTAGMTSIALPADTVLVRDIRYKFGDIYVPLVYDDQSGCYSYVGSGDEQAFVTRFKLIGYNIVFDPPVAYFGTNYLQIERVKYPASMTLDADVIDPQFDRACLNYVKYKACSILSGSIEKESRPWSMEEAEWFDAMKKISARRVMSSTRIKEFL